MTEELDESLRQGQPLKEQFKELKERYNDKNRELRAAKVSLRLPAGVC